MVNIALATDSNLLPHMSVVIKSLLAHTSEPVRFYIMTRQITSQLFNFKTSKYPKAEYIQIKMDDYKFGKVKLARWVTLSTMDRIFMPSILKDVDKIVYLDIDVVVLDDIKKLFDYPTGECGIAAKRSTKLGYLTNVDYAVRTHIDFDKVYRICGKHPNFNAGVMVMDLNKLRKEGMQDFCLSLVEETRCNDQIAVASYSRGRFNHIADRWNTWVGVDHERIPDPAILHYVGNRKPWHSVTPLNDIWNKYR